MKLVRSLSIAAAVCLTTASMLPDAYAADTDTDNASLPDYRRVNTISAPDLYWDYAAVDATARRLYVGVAGGVLAVNLVTGALEPALIKSPFVNGIAPLPGGVYAVGTNPDEDTVFVFDGDSGKLVHTVAAGKQPDGITYEPRYNLVAVAANNSQQVTLIDAMQGKQVGAVKVGGTPESMAADGRGLLYTNVEDKNSVAVIDVGQRKLIERIAMPGCEDATGIAADPVARIVVSVCRNGVVSIISQTRHNITDSFSVEPGPDAVMIDSARRVAFIPSADTGTLNIVALSPDQTGKVVQTLETEVNARTGALDPVTGRVYIPTGKLIESSHPDQGPEVVAGSFHLLVYAPVGATATP